MPQLRIGSSRFANQSNWSHRSHRSHRSGPPVRTTWTSSYIRRVVGCVGNTFRCYPIVAPGITRRTDSGTPSKPRGHMSRSSLLRRPIPDSGRSSSRPRWFPKSSAAWARCTFSPLPRITSATNTRGAMFDLPSSILAASSIRFRSSSGEFRTFGFGAGPGVPWGKILDLTNSLTVVFSARASARAASSSACVSRIARITDGFPGDLEGRPVPGVAGFRFGFEVRFGEVLFFMKPL